MQARAETQPLCQYCNFLQFFASQGWPRQLGSGHVKPRRQLEVGPFLLRHPVGHVGPVGHVEERHAARGRRRARRLACGS